MTEKPKIAFCWCVSCGECEEAIRDFSREEPGLARRVELIRWPSVSGRRCEEEKKLPDGSIHAAFVNGALRDWEQEEAVRLLRRKTRFLAVFGNCARLAGVPGLEDPWNRRRLFTSVYRNNGWSIDSLRPPDEVVSVDYTLPGCAPSPEIVAQAIEALLGEAPPPRGSVLLPEQTVCEDCPRRDSRPERLDLAGFRQVQVAFAGGENCILAQGLLCLGPVTRGGCAARCIRGEMPCAGCFGPASGAKGGGGSAWSAAASLAGSGGEKEMDRILNSAPGLIGSFYRYGLPLSLLRLNGVAARAHGG